MPVAIATTAPCCCAEVIKSHRLNLGRETKSPVGFTPYYNIEAAIKWAWLAVGILSAVVGWMGDAEGGWGRLMLVEALACGASVVTPLRFSCSVFCTADAPRWRVAIVGPRLDAARHVPREILARRRLARSPL